MRAPIGPALISYTASMKLADTPPVDPALARRRAAMTLRYAGEGPYRPSRRPHPRLLACSQAMGGVPEMIPEIQVRGDSDGTKLVTVHSPNP